MAGLDLPAKLRRSLGGGQVLSDSALAEHLEPYDRDKDGRLTKSELMRFLGDKGVGGPWFCEMLANTVWKKSQQSFEREVDALPRPLLARVLHFAMARTERPTRRYVITPEVVRGEKPRLDPENRPVDELSDDQRGRRAAPPAPRGAPPARAPQRAGEPPKAGGAPRAAAPRGAAPRGPAPRAPAKGPAVPGRGPAPRGRAPARPSAGRSGPRRPSGRSR